MLFLRKDEDGKYGYQVPMISRFMVDRESTLLGTRMPVVSSIRCPVTPTKDTFFPSIVKCRNLELRGAEAVKNYPAQVCLNFIYREQP